MLQKQLHFDGLAKPAMMIFVSTIIGGACNYLYQSWMGHSLTPAEYSVLSSLLSLYYILTIPSNLVGRTVLRHVSVLNSSQDGRGISWLIHRSFVISMVVGVIMLVAVLIATPWLLTFLELPEESLLLILAVGAFFLMVGPPAVGATQGLQRFYKFGIYNMTFPAAKLILGIILVSAGLGVAGAFGGAVIGTTIAFAVVYWAIKDHLKGERSKPDTKGMAAYAIPVAIATFSFTFITNVDTFLARGLLSPYQAGLYSAASMLGKIVLWLPVAITTVTFPRFSEAETRDDNSISLMRKSVLITFLSLLAIWAVFVIFPDEIMNIAYGYHYLGATIILPVVIAAFSLFGLASVFMNYGLARNDINYVAIIVCFTLIGTELVLVNHFTPMDIGYDMLASAAGICITSFVYMELHNRYRIKNG